MDTSCQEKPVDTLTVTISWPPLPFLFCTSIPPGLTSHSISPAPPPTPLSPPPQAAACCCCCLDEEVLLLNSLLEYLSLIMIVAKVQLARCWLLCNAQRPISGFLVVPWAGFVCVCVCVFV